MASAIHVREGPTAAIPDQKAFATTISYIPSPAAALPVVLHDAQSDSPRLHARPATMVPATLVVFALLAAIGAIRKVRQYYALHDFGGHWSAGWSRLWLLQTQSSGEMNKRFTDINRRHGECRTSREPTDATLGPDLI